METNRIGIKDINNDSVYQGYTWMSDADEPIVVNDCQLGLEISGQSNPFIIEGQLWNSERKKSYSIKFVDGEYLITEYCLTDDDLCRQEHVYYCANRMPGHPYLHFLRFWELESDSLCEGKEVLTPKQMVFVGFSDKNLNLEEE